MARHYQTSVWWPLQSVAKRQNWLGACIQNLSLAPICVYHEWCSRARCGICLHMGHDILRLSCRFVKRAEVQCTQYSALAAIELQITRHDTTNILQVMKCRRRFCGRRGAAAEQSQATVSSKSMFGHNLATVGKGNGLILVSLFFLLSC